MTNIFYIKYHESFIKSAVLIHILVQFNSYSFNYYLLEIYIKSLNPL